MDLTHADRFSWRGVHHVEIGSGAYWELGPLRLWARRDSREWSVSFVRGDDALAEASNVQIPGPGEPEGDVTTTRFGFDVAHMRMEEDLAAGVTDRLSFGNANVLFRFAQGPSVQMRVGLGGIWMRDELGTDEGFMFVYEGDFFPKKPIVLSGGIGLGTLGEASVFHFRATVGTILGRWETFIGYDSLGVDSVSIGGPGLGVRCWF